MVKKGCHSLSISLAILVLLSIIAALALTLSSCDRGYENNPPESTPDTEATTNPTLTAGALAKYKIVRANGAPTETLRLLLEVSNYLSENTGIVFGVDDDWVKKGEDPSNDEYEILLGETNRPESVNFRASLGFSGYGVKIEEKKIIIAGKSDFTLSKAVELFKGIVKENLSLSPDGEVVLNLPAGFRAEGKLEGIGFPDYEGGALSGIYDCGDGALEYYITGTDDAGFSAYLEALGAAGYSPAGENSAGGNRFASYIKDGVHIYSYYIKSSGEARIIREKAGPALPSAEYKKVTESSITQIGINVPDKTNGMGYIVTLEDGSYFLVDGGFKEDADNIYNYISKNNKRSDGKIVIAGWLITHSHTDHYSGFDAFAKKYGRQVVLEYLFFNHFPASVGPTDGEYSIYLSSKYLTALSYFPGVKVIKPHTGQRIALRNATLEILYTHEDLYPIELKKLNNASLVSRLEIAGQSIMFLADAQGDASDRLCEMYGDYLKSDMVQVAHHGGLGASADIYRLIDAAVAFWPSSRQIYETESVNRAVNVYFINRLNLKEIITGFGENKTRALPYMPK